MQVQNRRSESGAWQGLDLELPARATMLSQVRSVFADLPLPAPAVTDARLLVSELVANSMRHAGLGPDDLIHVTAEVTPGCIRVDVIDGGGSGTRPLTTLPRPGTEPGWGLYLVETLSTRWGHDAGRYWFELEFEPPNRRRR
jgi:anti-sigma regulatory factor (Ser/Thr protein kinase)